MTDALYNAIARAVATDRMIANLDPTKGGTVCRDCGRGVELTVLSQATMRCRTCRIARTNGQEHQGGVGLDLGPTDRAWKDTMLGPDYR